MLIITDFGEAPDFGNTGKYPRCEGIPEGISRNSGQSGESDMSPELCLIPPEPGSLPILR